MKKHMHTKSWAIALACLAASCGEDRGQSGQGPGQVPEMPEGPDLEWQVEAPVTVKIRDVTPGRSTESQATVLVQELYGQVVVKSERDASGAVRTTVFDKEQKEQLYRTSFTAVGEPRQWEFVVSGLKGQVPGEQVTKRPELGEANEAAASTYLSVSAMAGEQGYSRGCSSVAGPASCSNSGACCDVHDACFSKHGCDPSSWRCNIDNCTEREQCVVHNEGIIGVSRATEFCGTTEEQVTKCKSNGCAYDDKADECARCNQDAVSCFQRGDAGPSSCCYDGSSSGYNNTCGNEFPPCCWDTNGDGKDDGNGYIKPNGRCDCEAAGCSGGSQASDTCDGYEPPAPPPASPCGMDGVIIPGVGMECPPYRPDPDNCSLASCIPGPGKSSPIIYPIDPNDKIGPSEETVSRTVPFAYTVNFENMSGASATAQEVVIVDYLDPGFDWSTLDFTEISYGGRTLTVPEGVTNWSRVDEPAIDGCVLWGQGPLAVQVSTTFDVQTGRLELRLKVIDPVTGTWPDDPYAGILPPGGTEACRQGHVKYSVMVAPGTPDGTALVNVADIVFDYNAPIRTNEVSNFVGP